MTLALEAVGTSKVRVGVLVRIRVRVIIVMQTKT